MRRFVIPYFLTALVCAPFASVAAPRCENVFAAVKETSSLVRKPWSPEPEYQAYTGGLDLKRLAKAGYTIRDGRLYEVANNIDMGELKVFQPEYLFQWADADFHQDVVKNRGIFKEWMHEILNSQPQTAGRGFYVSTSPFDSISYGTAATVFQVKNPVYVLVMAEKRLLSELSISAEKTERLADAGIDALTYLRYQPTWFNFISSRHLQSLAKSFPPGTLRPALDAAIFPGLETSFLLESRVTRVIFFLKELDPEFPSDLINSVYMRLSKDENLRKIFASSSDDAKLFASALHYERYLEGVSRLGNQQEKTVLPEMFSYLLEGVKKNSKSETVMMAMFWQILTPEQRALVPTSPYFEYLKKFAEYSITQNLSEPDLMALAQQTDLQKIRSLLQMTLKDRDKSRIFKNFGILFKALIEKSPDTRSFARVSDYLNILKGSLYGEWKGKVAAYVRTLQPRSEQEKLYGSLLDIYDFKTLLKNKSSLKRLKEVAARYQVARSSIDIEKIENLQDFMKAGEVLFGTPLELRDELASDTKTGVFSLLSSKMPTNKFISTQMIPEKGGFNTVKIDYWNPKIEISENLNLLSDKYYSLRKKNSQDPRLLQMGLLEMLDKLVTYNFESADPTKPQFGVVLGEGAALRAEDLHKIFISLRPLKQGNEQMGLLLYEILKYRAEKVHLPLGYVKQDWSLYLTADNRVDNQYFGMMSRIWVRAAKDDQEFLDRVQLVMDILKLDDPLMMKIQ